MDVGATSRMRRILVTGPPGVGKTTICKTVASLLAKGNRRFDGFYTEEVRNENRARIGFDIIRVNDAEKRLPLARVESLLGEQERSKHKVGHYHVFVENFEAIALPVLHSNADVLLIDEIGKMELFSARFYDDVQKILFQTGSGRTRVIATIPLIQKVPQRYLQFFKKLCDDAGSKVINVTRQNRDKLAHEMIRAIS